MGLVAYYKTQFYIYDNSDQHYHLKLLMSHHDQTQLVESRLPNCVATNFSIGSVTWVSNFWRYSALICPIISFGAPHGFTWPPILAKCCLNLLIPPPWMDFWQYLQIILPSIISQWAHAVSSAFGGMMTPWMVDHRSEKFITQKKNSWTADSNEELSSANPYLEMQTSSLSLLLKMATPLTATHFLQNSSNSNSKMTTSA